MNCPGCNAASYEICLKCRACYPGLSPRVQELLEVGFDVRDPVSLVEAVMA